MEGGLPHPDRDVGGCGCATVQAAGQEAGGPLRGSWKPSAPTHAPRESRHERSAAELCLRLAGAAGARTDHA